MECLFAAPDSLGAPLASVLPEARPTPNLGFFVPKRAELHLQRPQSCMPTRPLKALRTDVGRSPLRRQKWFPPLETRRTEWQRAQDTLAPTNLRGSFLEHPWELACPGDSSEREVRQAGVVHPGLATARLTLGREDPRVPSSVFSSTKWAWEPFLQPQDLGGRVSEPRAERRAPGESPVDLNFLSSRCVRSTGVLSVGAGPGNGRAGSGVSWGPGSRASWLLEA